MSTCATLGAFFCAGGPRISLAQFCTACIWPRIRGLTMQPLPAVHTTWRARRIGAMCSLLPRERWVTCGRVDDATRSAALRHLCMPTPTRHTPHTTSMCCASTGLLVRLGRHVSFLCLSSQITTVGANRNGHARAVEPLGTGPLPPQLLRTCSLRALPPNCSAYHHQTL
jgi:hypothetical protein